MKIKTTQSSIRTITSDDPKFHIQDGLVYAPRAGFEIVRGCPKEYRMVIQECISNKWLRPIANIRDSELFWEEFQK
jgi:hypothetical protein